MRRGVAAGVSFRTGTEADLPECNRIWREGIDAYLLPMGFPPLPTDNPGLRRLHAHTLATDPTRFVVAERDVIAARVFPALIENMLPYRTHLERVDLRVGVETQGLGDDHAKQALVLKVCLEDVRR